MPPPPLVVALCGSLRQESWNRRVLGLFAERAIGHFVVESVDLREVPLFDQDVEDAGHPSSVAELHRRVSVANGVVVSTPEYNGGVSGVAKNAIDWLSRPEFAGPLVGKPTAVLAVAPGRGRPERAGLQAHEALQLCLADLVAPAVVINKLSRTVDPATGVFPEPVLEAIDQLVVALAESIGNHRDEGASLP